VVIISGFFPRDLCQIFRNSQQGLKLLPISVDNNGLVAEQLLEISASHPIKLLYITPSHQSPLGVVLSLPRRLKLLDWAKITNAIIIEEDFDSEYRYSGRPIPSLQGLQCQESVIYVKDFCEAMFPALRLGYLVAPRWLVDILARAKRFNDRQPPMLEQRVMTDFINEGLLEQHIRRMRSLYQRRRQSLVTALQETFQDQVKILGEPVGTHLTVRFQTHLDNEAIIKEAEHMNIEINSTQQFYMTDGNQGEFIFGFGALPESAIREGIERLSKILKGH
jgi:GntR family transcriptional regulator/MocR family aminotransferase